VQNQPERTVKVRIQTPDTAAFDASAFTASANVDRQVHEFIDTHVPFNSSELEPKLWNRFLRITMVSKVALNADTGPGRGVWLGRCARSAAGDRDSRSQTRARVFPFRFCGADAADGRPAHAVQQVLRRCLPAV